MKQLIITLAFFLVLTSCKKENKPLRFGGGANDAPTPTVYNDTSYAVLTVSIANIPSLNGSLFVALHNNSTSFNTGNNPYKYLIVPVSSNTQQISFSNVMYGRYAIAVFHDDNNNGELDVNWLGIPKEYFGFSNNAMGNFGPPSFSDCDFDVKDSIVTIPAIGLKKF